MSSIDDLRRLTTPPPTGWEPGLQWDGQTGHVTTPPMAAGETPDGDTWNHVLEKFGLDPARYMIDGPVRHSAWDVPGHGVQTSHRARIVERPERTFDVERLLEDMYLDPEDIPTGRGQVWRTVQIGDTHIGKGALDGGGSDHIIQQWKRSVTAALDCAPRAGIHLAFLGDLIEGQVSQGGANIAGNDLTLTEQLRVARHLVLWTIQRAMEVAPRVIVSATAGNHGETTRLQNRPFTDSYDLDIVHAVQQAIELTDLAEYVDFYYPEPDDAHVTYQVGDTVFTCAHGHLFRGKMTGAERWWADMTINGHAPGAAQILLAGHFHSAQISNYTENRWILFGPSLERHSNWIQQRTGATARAGVLTFDTEHGTPMNITIH